MEKIPFIPQRWQVAAETDRWKVAYLGYCERFGSLTGMERHLETDEVFVLLRGEATLYVEEAVFPMEQGVVYNVKKGEWHHIVVSEDAAVLVAENSDTTPDNTEKRSVSNAHK